MSDDRYPEAALAQAAIAHRAGQYDVALLWCTVAMQDFWALATGDQREAFKERMGDSLDMHLQRRQGEPDGI